MRPVNTDPGACITRRPCPLQIYELFMNRKLFCIKKIKD
nr:MAG TPA: hypothetical protein [Caudoviricetes sp.]